MSQYLKGASNSNRVKVVKYEITAFKNLKLSFFKIKH